MSATLTLRDAIATLRVAGIEDAPRDARLMPPKASPPLSPPVQPANPWRRS
jgi:hypothetical protein